jgi:MFS family permease
VGFFANANHFAAFEYSLLPLAAAALSELRLRSLAFFLSVFGVVIPALLFGLTLSGSRSAVILGALSLIAAVPMLLGPETARWGRKRTFAVAAVVAIVIIPLMGGLGLMAIFTRLATQDVAEDVRWILAAETGRAILNYFPFGAGVGTFPRVYPLLESASALIPEFVNRAHNDLLETLFEGGLGSLSLLLAFLGWLFLTMRRTLFGDFEVVGPQARAGVIVIALLLVHSLWDYPLRTIALETLFALCVALQFAPPAAPEDDRGAWWLRLVRKKGGRKRRRRSRKSAKPLQKPAVTAVQ